MNVLIGSRIYSFFRRLTLQICNIMADFEVFGNRNLNVNQMNQEISRGIAPKTIDRVDQAYQSRPGDSSAHVHFEGGKHALRDDGTWKHGGRKLSRAEKQWLQNWNWPLPNDQ
ncbi:unnamed protein product [Adineta ricciae]|uniref:Uncharacterized protein n=1 Tax=Adineta ricciae TaxID=249248 RepID=A0A815E3P8_ADIRI|nr:unnamed protein product [Adineta ricciae]